MDSYDFGAKAMYRIRVWNEIEKRCAKPKALRSVIYLDTREALETTFLLARGYAPENLIAVNRDPVEVALLTQKLDKAGLGRVHTIGMDWRRAVSERMEGRSVDIVNFDGTSNLNGKLHNLLADTAYRLRPRVMAINMLAGREMGYIAETVKDLTDVFDRKTSSGQSVRMTHLRRITDAFWSVVNADSPRCLFHLDDPSWDVYVSASGQPMVWGVVRLWPHKDMSERDVERKVESDALKGHWSMLWPPCMRTQVNRRLGIKDYRELYASC